MKNETIEANQTNHQAKTGVGYDIKDPQAETKTTGGYSIPAEWTFERDDIAKAFDQHVREQLPWYDLATTMVSHFARHFLPQGGRMYDIGASTGNITRNIANVISSRNIEAHSIENTEEMVKQWRGVGSIHHADCQKFEYQPYDFAVIFLVLMFLPEKTRKQYVQNLLSKMEDGGALLVVEKVTNTGDYLGNAMARLTLAGKVHSGVPAEEIVAKELSLGGVQRPIGNNFFLHMAGINATVVFQFGEFKGWVIQKSH